METIAYHARIARHGGPDVIEWVEGPLPEPGADEVRIATRAVGLNFIDTYHRRGIYPVPLPSGLGSEAAGIVDAVGAGVTDLVVGDRVATFGPKLGAYASSFTTAAKAAVKLPDDIDMDVAAAALLKGCTAEFLAERAADLHPGDWALVHAAAGGVGSILTQWLVANGVRVIGTVGDDAKAATVTALGAEATIPSRDVDIAARVRELTGGKGVAVTFDGIGQATWRASLAATARRGLVISYGNADAPVTGVALGDLNTHGSLFVTRPKLFDYYVTPAERAAGVERLWDMIRARKVTITIGQRYPLCDAAQAHRDLEARRTHGSTILLP